MKAVVVPPPGLGDALGLRGLVAELMRSHDRVLVGGLTRHREDLAALFEDLAPAVALALVDSPDQFDDLRRLDGYRVIEPSTSNPAEFKLPASRSRASAAVLARVRELAGGAPFVIADDPSDHATDPEVNPEGNGTVFEYLRRLDAPSAPSAPAAPSAKSNKPRVQLPADVGDAVVFRTDDARLGAGTIFDLADALRHAAGLHAAPGSAAAALVRLAGLGTPVTVHAYVGDPAADPADVDAARVLTAPPALVRYGGHLVPRDEFGACLRANFHHFGALQDLMRPTKAEWYPCGSYLMGPGSMDYEPSMHAKQALLFAHAKGKRSVLEIGVHGGHSLLMVLLAGAAHVTCVDICSWAHTAACVAYLQAHFPGRVTLLRGDSRAVLPLIQDSFDMIHVDGDHSYEGAKFDMQHSHRLSHRDTTFIFDDFCGDIAAAAGDLGLFDILDVPSCAWNNCLARRRAV